MGLLNRGSFNAFTLRALQDVSTVLTIAQRLGITSVEELKKVISDDIYSKVPRDTRSSARVRSDGYKKAIDKSNLIRCSECNQYMNILAVNNTPSTKVGGDYNSCSVCYNENCMHVEYYTETVQELIDKAK